MDLKKDKTIGAAALLAITAAVVGISMQPGTKPAENGTQAAAPLRTKTTAEKTQEEKPGCGSIRDQFKNFLGLNDSEFLNTKTKIVVCPQGDDPASWADLPAAQKTSGLKFVIALAPDPVHTHLSLLFDEIAVAVQEAAQDEKYDFDSSWLPWDDQKPSYPLLMDQKQANKEQEGKETQPGIILFRNRCRQDSQNASPGKCDDDPAQAYSQGLVVFLVGEEATAGVHRDQFRNAAAWIAALHPNNDRGKKLAILGPTFSGSLPSLQQLLSDDAVKNALGFPGPATIQQLPVYSGSVSGKDSALKFHSAFPQFHSFLQNDDEIVKRFLDYMCDEQGKAASRIAVLSEDETAYGRAMTEEKQGDSSGIEPKGCSADRGDFELLNLYYPRDISALRDAYQSKVLAQTGSSSQISDLRRNLPLNLADPSGRVRDSIRSYGGNQTPLAQEAILLQILAELHDHRVTYIVLRGSNALDQLFLANFLHRSYPDGRIVLFSADLLFMRERGADSLSGMLTLSTYPLVTHVHEWTEYAGKPAATRAFGADAVEGDYIALRLLLNDQSFNAGSQRCRISDDTNSHIFLPPVICGNEENYFPIPDYALPFWIDQHASGEGQKCPTKEVYCGPPAWLSVVGESRFWPVAALFDGPAQASNVGNHEDAPETPLEMKIVFLVLIGFSFFHAWCCWSGSYTAKPAFRAHFAHQGDSPHRFLVLFGTACIVLMALIAGLGAGVFSNSDSLPYPAFALICMVVALLAGLAAVLGNAYTGVRLRLDVEAGNDARQKHRDEPEKVELGRRKIAWCNVLQDKSFVAQARASTGWYMIAGVVLWLITVLPLENTLKVENRELTYWRGMHLFSGLSPVAPVLILLAGLYLAFWFALHGMALFGSDKPMLPACETLRITLPNQQEPSKIPLLRMVSQEDAGAEIEDAAWPLHKFNLLVGAVLAVLFLSAVLILAKEVPIRTLERWNYSMVFLAGLDVCCLLVLVGAWQLAHSWMKLKRLLTFLDRLTLRRTLSALHGFSWESVWKMSGNVLEVRYKIISRQIEAMNHTLAALNKGCKTDVVGSKEARDSLEATVKVSRKFAVWYAENYMKAGAGDLTDFRKFQESVAATSGTLLTKLLIPAWRAEEDSLIADPFRSAEDKEKEGAPNPLPRAKEAHIRNAEELVCLTFLGFIQNALGRLRTIALTIVVLFLACTLAISSYPFDPRQGLSTVLVLLFLIAAVVTIKIYAEMHRDSTLSHVTNTRPGELGSEFWFKIGGFGFAPLIGLLARIFPGLIDFIFSWIQPGISSLK